MARGVHEGGADLEVLKNVSTRWMCSSEKGIEGNYSGRQSLALLVQVVVLVHMTVAWKKTSW